MLDDTITLRLPGDLKDRMAKLADGDGRSLSNWAVRVLQDAVAADARPPVVSSRKEKVEQVKVVLGEQIVPASVLAEQKKALAGAVICTRHKKIVGTACHDARCAEGT